MGQQFDLSDFRVKHGNDPIDLKQFGTKLKGAYGSDADYEQRLGKAAVAMQDFQNMLYANQGWALLLCLHGMDTAGKDGFIKHALGGFNPLGVHVTSFKRPTETEFKQSIFARHDAVMPERGEIAVWNRSHYEEVLIVRVHPDILKARGIEPHKFDSKFWNERLEQINSWEALAHDTGRVQMVKIFLNISPDEQARRLLSRLEDKSKNWKFEPGDMKEREHWDEYQAAYAAALGRTSTKDAPWYVVPGDDKKAARLLGAQIVNHHLEAMDLAFPPSRTPKPDMEAFAAQLRKELGE